MRKMAIVCLFPNKNATKYFIEISSDQDIFFQAHLKPHIQYLSLKNYQRLLCKWNINTCLQQNAIISLHGDLFDHPFTTEKHFWFIFAISCVKRSKAKTCRIYPLLQSGGRDATTTQYEKHKQWMCIVNKRILHIMAIYKPILPAISQWEMIVAIAPASKTMCCLGAKTKTKTGQYIVTMDMYYHLSILSGFFSVHLSNCL